MKMFMMSGLPRTGSTLLSSILSQNPDIHAEGNSAVCQLMWDAYVSCEDNCKEQLLANNRIQTQQDIISAIPSLYYKNIEAKYVVDKCRSWTLPANMDLIYNYITPTPKIIVLIRPLEQIIASFLNLPKTGKDLYRHLLEPQSEPLTRSYDGVLNAMKNNSGEFIFIKYDELVGDTKTTLDKIYQFCSWEPFEHDLTNIINKSPEDDSVYGTIGQHDVRPTIGKREYSIKLPDETLRRCRELNKQIGLV